MVHLTPKQGPSMGLIMMLTLACLALAASIAQAAPSIYEQSHGMRNLGKIIRKPEVNAQFTQIC